MKWKGSGIDPSIEETLNKNLTRNYLNKKAFIMRQHGKLLFQYAKYRINIIYNWEFCHRDLNKLQ